jgi:hypothetical protein
MPSGIYPIHKRQRSSGGGSGSPGLALRIRTRLGRSRLDKQLAQGVDPAASPELALRAQQLRSPTERARIANALVEALGEARRVGEPLTIRPLGYRAAVRDAADDILALALLLRDDQPVGTATVAMAAWLVGSRSSPMRRDGAGDLHEAIRAALGAPEARQPAATSVIDPRAA